MLSALGWGALAAVSLVVGALLAFVRTWCDRQIGLVLVMLIDSMIPEATRGAGRVAGLPTTLGFAVATALSTMS
jgi:ZIP family zinc transporter